MLNQLPQVWLLESMQPRLFKGEDEVIFPHTTAIGSLPYYVTHAESKHFQPMNVNFGIIKELEGPRIRDKKERYEKIAERALKDLQPFISSLDNIKIPYRMR